MLYSHHIPTIIMSSLIVVILSWGYLYFQLQYLTEQNNCQQMGDKMDAKPLSLAVTLN